ncbi:DUF4082 domain-containing protein [Georgenia muralis]|uniref:Ig-like domain-containing protein n=1 Tax=Georgenia muralis TaxID=154117 RepID=A0A3N4ZKB8_9MICO|nr:DUF4082 domain-containing protein [Georgenia muralis]RPF26092.1 Ig-like domain-containing protein [Georgenia muralis]
MRAPAAVLRTARRRVAGALLGAAMLSPVVIAVAATPASADPCGPAGNEITCENSKPGTDPAEWDIRNAGDEGIQGFATDISVNKGQRVDFKIDTDAQAYTVTIYRTGWYGGLGAREIATVAPAASLPQSQPECVSDLTTELYDCGNWAVSASWDVPTSAVSGVYIARLHRADTNESSHITFVVRDDTGASDVLFQTSDTTWHAYNSYGGSSFYEGAVNGRAYKLSYNRPFNTRAHASGRDFYFASEYAMVRFLERNGYDVSYSTDVDTDRRGELLKTHDAFLSVGHDEYWSGRQRANIEAARDAGVSLGFFTGNEGYWRIRWEDSVAGEPTAYRTMVSYKETWADTKIDPSPEWTGTWRDPRFASTQNGGGLPENGVTGTAYMVNYSDLPVRVSAEEGKYRLWRNTSLSSLPAGGTAELAPHTVGYESNEDLDNGFRPEGLIRLSTTTGEVPQYLQDFGRVVAEGTTTHHTTLYRAPSGALVFSTGSIQWSWGLDQEHDGDGAAPDPRMQQATVNLFADMGVQPATLQSGLVAATKTTDTTGPSVSVTTPTAGQSIANGTSVTATGTAADTGGGRVAGVEVSTDGGTSWHPATGTEQWTYTYVQHGLASTPLLVRAVDDSANIGDAARVDVSVSCPCSVFGAEVPAQPEVNDGAGLELGLTFSPTVDGFATGVRFYKGTGNTGTHTGSVWTSTGQRLGSVQFTDESASGWQTALFTTPVALSAGTTYVVSYTAPNGRYAAKSDAFWSFGVDARPLTVPGGFGSSSSGVYAAPGQFPSSSYNSSHYYVDVVFNTVDDTPLAIGSQSPLPGSSSVPWGTAVSAVMSKPVDTTSVAMTLHAADGTPVTGTTTYDSTTRTAAFTPDQPLATTTDYTAEVSATDPRGVGIEGATSWTFTTAAPNATEGQCPCSLFGDVSTPEVLEAADTDAVTLGVTFTSSQSGKVTAVRFYKGPGNIGTHVGTLWTETGTILAQGTFTAETTQGWQTLTFDAPVAIEKDVRYVASYRTTVGRYSYTPAAYTDWVQRGPLRVSPNGGAYTYADGFPGAGSSTTYLVDVVLEPDPQPLTVVSQQPRPGAIGVDTATTVTATFSGAVPTGSTLTLTGPDGAVTGEVTVAADGKTLVLAPDAPLALAAPYTAEATATGEQPESWSFETADETGCPCTLFSGDVPATASVADTGSLELGVTFTPSTAGFVTGIRFYKGPQNSGTHTGTLWSDTGQQLATVQFSAGTTGGWQTAHFSEPVEVAPGTTYMASYFAPGGGYSATTGFFSGGPYTVGPLTAGPENGWYRYGGGFPTSTYGGANYFVDVVFTPGEPAPLTVTAKDPADGAEAVALDKVITATLSKAPPTTPELTVTGPAGPVLGQSSYDATARQVSFTPSGQLPATAALTAAVTVGGTTVTDGTWSFQTAAVECPCTLFGNLLPETSSVPEPDLIELGTTFSSSESGVVTGIRFYKGPLNTGTHTGSLWTVGGTRLATVDFTGETDSGWQSATFAEPVEIAADTDYVVSYLAPEGGFARTTGYFAADHVAGPLTAPSTSNGRFRYGGGFPTEISSSGANYLVDVVFSPAAISAPTVVSTDPPGGADSVSIDSTITATLSKAPYAEPTLAVSGPEGPIAGASTYDALTRTVTFAPASPLPSSATVSVVASMGGTALSGGSWSFATSAFSAADCPCSLWPDTAVPSNESWNDRSAVQVGVRFTTGVDGYVTGVRFYKGLANTGTKTVMLWSPDGTLLASAASADESASGWQRVSFAEPVPVTAGQVYAVSYHTTSGRYSVTRGGLSSPYTRGPLTAQAKGGVYLYATGYPTNTSTTNYWVDPVFIIQP